MIYIGLVALFTLIGLTAYKTKNKEIEEKELFKSMAGMVIKIKEDITTKPKYSGLGNSILIADRIWSLNTDSDIIAGESVKITSAYKGCINVERISNVTELKIAA